MPSNVSPHDYMDARSRSATLLSEAAFGDSPAETACAAAGANLGTIAAWNRGSGKRIRLAAAA